MEPTNTTGNETTPRRTTIHPKRLIRPLLIIAILVVAALQVRFDYGIYIANSPGQNTDTTVTLIAQALRSVNKPAVIEPLSKKVYLPDASLVLPPAPQALGQGEVLYQYVPSTDGSDAEASVTLSNAVNSAISKLAATPPKGNAWRSDPTPIFEQVPNAQACARGVHMVFGSKTKYERLEASKKLADGRILNIYTEKEACSYSLKPLAEYLKQVQSY